MNRTGSLLMVVRSLPFHGVGGMEAVAWDLARAFHQAGVKVTVVTTQCPALEAENLIEGIEILCLPGKSGRYSRAWWRQTRALYDTRLQGRYDVIFSVSSGAMSIAAGRNTRPETPVYIAQSHGTTWSEILSKLALAKPVEWLKALYISNRLWRDRGYRLFDAIVSIGPQVTADHGKWPTRMLIGDTPVREIANGIDTGVFSFDPAKRKAVRAQFDIPAEAPLFLSASRLHPQKGVQHAINAFAIAYRQDPGLRYLIAGDGPHEAALKAQVEALGLTQAVRFAGAVKRDALYGLYSAADNFLFTTTRIEGLPLNILEALACGLPIVLSSHVVVDGQDGQWPVDPQDADGVARVLSKLAADGPRDDRQSLLADRYTLACSARSYFDLCAALRPSNRPSGTPC